ncbi:MAG: GNAT family N-acetyltransferase [Chloroflexi bacterium]|nr:GNAT family N-acetyltransferase [Chloroflexota bacterium]
MTDYTRNDVQIRPAQASDREALTTIAAQIWEGSDYLPYVIDEWLADESGSFDVLTLHAEVVGVSKLTKIADGEWWLEGLRIDPQHQGKGFARILHHYKINQVRQLGKGVVRFTTASHNEATRRLAAETGFQLVGEFDYYFTPAVKVPTSQRFWKLSEADFEEVHHWLSGSEYFDNVDRSFEESWTYHYATGSVLREYLRAGRVYAWNSQNDETVIEGLLFIYRIRERDNVLQVAFADVSPDQRYEFWNAARGLAHHLGAEQISVKILNDEANVMPFVSQNWDTEDFRLLLYSRPIDLTVESTIESETVPALE